MYTFENTCRIQIDAQAAPLAERVRQALDSLEADNDYLTKGDVFAPDMIAAYIELKREEQMAFETSPHPIEYKMYYSV